MNQSLRPARIWTRRHWPMLFSGTCLAAALWLAPRLVPGAVLPLEGIGLAILIFMFVRLQTPDSSAGFWRHATLYLPGQMIVGTACVAAGRLIWNWPWPAFAFLLVWFGLTSSSLFRFFPWPRLWRVMQQRIARYDDVALSGSLLVGGITFLAGRLDPSLDLTWPAMLVPALLWLTLDRIPYSRWQDAATRSSRLLGFAGRLVLWILLCGLAAALGGNGFTQHTAAGLLLGSGLMAGFALSHAGGVVHGAENARRTCLGLFAVWLIHPFASHHILGSGDAEWYANTLADFLAQVHRGVFPVFVGQSEYLFNGGVFPVRFAPLFHYYGLLVDALTLGTLNAPALQNGIIIATFLSAGVSAYVMLGRLLPAHLWVAGGLSVLYLSCPGVLAIVYHSDLFMTWTTLPWLPLALGGCMLTFRESGPRPLLLTAGGLGLLWWGHAPVALWTTLVVGLIQFIRLVSISPRRWDWPSLAAGATAFALIAAYPLVSVLAVPVETGAASYVLTHAGTIMHFMQESFPGILVPLILQSRSLADFQAGWPLLLLLTMCLVAAIRWRIRRMEFWSILAVPVGLQLLLVPIPSLSLWVWSALPGFLLNPTGNWAMQRLYVIIAASSICAVATLVAQPETANRRLIRWLGWMLIPALLWAAIEAHQFIQAKEARRRELALVFDPHLPENRSLTRYAYLPFAKPPAYYSHGHVDPLFEQRLLTPESQQLIGGNPAAIATNPAVGRMLQEGALTAEMLKPGDPWQIKPRFRLEPGKRYALELHFDHGAEPGVLLLNGPGFSRVYALPSYGERLSFGSGPGASSLLSLFTSGREPITVTLQFAEEQPVRAVDFSRFGTYRWLEVDPATLPVRVTNWIPYQAKVFTPAAAWLETPRMFQPGYRAVVNGQAVTPVKSREGLVTVSVPAGQSEVTLSYHPPLLLILAHWISLAAVVTYVGMLLLCTWRRSSRTADSAPRVPPAIQSFDSLGG